MMPETHYALHHMLSRFPQIPHALWQGLLVSRIDACAGFLEHFTLSDSEETAPYLMQKLSELMDTLPSDADNHAFIKLLAQEFEGFYLRASASGHCWNSLDEPFTTFVARYPDAELSISDTPIVAADIATAWFYRALGC